MTVDTILARQSGVISRDQAIAAGFTPGVVRHRLRMRYWRELHPRVYLAAGHRLDTVAKVRAALLWAGRDAVLCGAAAAWWQGMSEHAPIAIGITVPRDRRPRPRHGITVRRRTLADEDRAMHRGLSVTARPLTVLEAAVELGTPGSLLLDRALQIWVRFPQVYAAHCRNLARHGSATAGRLLVAAADRSASVAERLLVTLLRSARVEGWQCGFPVGDHLVDIAFPASRVAIEVDGWAWHMDAQRAADDKRRQNALVRQGWTILRYTWHDLTGRPTVVIAEIEHAARPRLGDRRPGTQDGAYRRIESPDVDHG